MQEREELQRQDRPGQDRPEPGSPGEDRPDQGRPSEKPRFFSVERDESTGAMLFREQKRPPLPSIKADDQVESDRACMTIGRRKVGIGPPSIIEVMNTWEE